MGAKPGSGRCDVIRIKVKRSGGGLASERRAIHAGLAEAVWDLTKQARLDLGIRFIHTFREPTGYYESRVTAERMTPLIGRVHDNNVVYGPWLEGVGSRNYPVTRFRGYHAFKLVAQALQAEASRVAEAAIRRHLGAV